MLTVIPWAVHFESTIYMQEATLLHNQPPNVALSLCELGSGSIESLVNMSM